MFTGLEDADNDGTNNVNDLDNAGEFMPILVKTHQSATNAYFRFDYDSDNLRLWVKDGTEIRTNNVVILKVITRNKDLAVLEHFCNYSVIVP